MKSVSPQGEVLLDLVAGHEKRRPHGIERARAAVRRQIAHVNLHTEQVADGIAVLPTIEPAHRDLSSVVADDFACGYERVRERVKKLRLASALGLFCIVRRHLAGVQLIENLLPPVSAFDGRNCECDVIEPQLAFLLFLVVALDAVVLEEDALRFIELRMGHLRRRGADEADEGKDKDGKRCSHMWRS